MSGELKLTAAQQQAITSLTENRALLSGAGCGKTFVLARRFTELLLRALAAGNVENPLLGLVALTFTEKAALEMQHRIRAFLRERLAAAGSVEDRALLRQWLEALPEARISTIHSFCAALLRGHAIEAGLDPDFRVAAEQIVTDRMQAEAAEQAVLSAVESGDETVARLLAANSFNAVVAQVRRLLADRERIALDANDDPAATLQQWADALAAAQKAAGDRIHRNAAFRDALSQLESYTCGDPADKLLLFYEQVVGAAHAVLNQPFTDCGEPMETLASIKPGNVGSKTAWNAPPKEVRDAMKAVGAAVAEEAVFAGPLNEQDEQAARTLAAVTQLARDANRRYAAAKREQGLVDFADLIISARDVLAASPALAKAVGEGIRQILIDEAQDTDATQIGLLLRLLGDDGALATVGEGRLFVVGDAKQSIYRFRGAQVEVFQRLCEGLGRDRQIDLARSFRTHPGGVAFVNHVFGRLLGEDYSPIEAHREESPVGPAVDILLAGEDDARSTQHRQAAVVAEHIEAMLREGRQVWDSDAETWRAVRPGDIAILFSRMTVSGPYERELQKRGMDYYVVAGSGFFRQQEVYDVLNALRVIDNPFDDIAFFGLLRSGMVGLDDNALMHIAETHRPPYLPTLNVDALAERLSKPQQAALQRAKDIVEPLSQVKDAVGIGELVERVLAATGYEAALLSQWKGKRMAGNVRQLLAQARAADGQLSLAEFIAQMDEFTLSDTRYEQAGTSGEDEDVVRLMTIHKAKGLEFPVVIVPDLNAGRQGPTGPTLHRLDWGLTTKLQFSETDDDLEPRSYAIARQLEDRDDQAETLRRYYVALTRHRDHLVLVGDNARLKKDERFKGGDCFLNALDGIFELSDAVADVGDEAEIRYGSDGGYAARVCVVRPASARMQRAGDSPGDKLLSRAADGGSLGELLRKDAGDPHAAAALPLVGPLPAELGHVELATTALTEFEACPALYRWRYELRAPTQQHAPDDSQPEQPQVIQSARSDILDPLTFGTLLHRCMELLDVRRPASAELLLRQAAADLDLDDATVIRAAASEFQPMLARFLASALAADLRNAETIHRELDFTTEAGLATIRGQIDLLYRRDGVWHVVDYKSDRVSGDPAAKLDRYSLQLLIYADAVRRFTDDPQAPADASLHFLRTGDVCTIPIDADQLASARSRISDLVGRLITARRSGSFPRCGRDSCDFCRQPHLAHVAFEQHADA